MVMGLQGIGEAMEKREKMVGNGRRIFPVPGMRVFSKDSA
jgi:hypothetical protein